MHSISHCPLAPHLRCLASSLHIHHNPAMDGHTAIETPPSLWRQGTTLRRSRSHRSSDTVRFHHIGHKSLVAWPTTLVPAALSRVASSPPLPAASSLAPQPPIFVSRAPAVAVALPPLPASFFEQQAQPFVSFVPPPLLAFWLSIPLLRAAFAPTPAWPSAVSSDHFHQASLCTREATNEAWHSVAGERSISAFCRNCTGVARRLGPMRCMAAWPNPLTVPAVSTSTLRLLVSHSAPAIGPHHRTVHPPEG
mmetsp:Transcript_56615/g.132856  ORF Transcript_56615/g.132856 Transcript_56615/m.132856 type:complete len:251 (+) Transcript_56615:251-1003(+)